MTDDADILVLRQGTEGLSMASYADELRARLPDRDVRHARTPAAEREGIETARVVTGITVDEDLVSRAERLELFACTFAGTDHVPVSALTDRGVVVTNAGGIHAPGIAEQVIGNILVFSRRLHRAWKQKDRHEWRHFQAGEVTGKTVTVVGMGSIGQAVVKRLQGFDAQTIAVRHSPEKGGLVDEVIGYDQDAIHEVLSRTDYLVIACPLTDLTRGLIDADAFDTLPPDAVLINVARGPIVDTDALVAAIQANEIRGAALDVTDPEPLPADHPLWRFGNCLITPHTGGSTPKHWERLADIVAHNVRAVSEGAEVDTMRNVVAAPDD